MTEKPVCRLVGEDGNAFAIIARVEEALSRAGLREKAAEFVVRAFACESYDDLLLLVHRCVRVQ